jgi:hypothetical protein
MILTVIALLTISQLGVCSARSLVLKDGYLSAAEDISKRNSWWSKKSLDSVPDYNRIIQEPAYDDIAMGANSDRHSQSPGYSSLFSCYIKDCVPRFVQCAQIAVTENEYAECKRRHELCGTICGSISEEETLI